MNTVRRITRARVAIDPLKEPADKPLGKGVLRVPGRKAIGRPIGETRTTAGRKAMFLAALESTFCNVTKASKKCGLDRGEHYRWMNDDPSYREKYNNLIEKRHDFVEDHVIQMIREHNTVIVKHYLDCHVKHRGWGNTSKHEISGPDGDAIQSNIKLESAKNEVVPDAVVSILKTLVTDNDKVQRAIKRLGSPTP